MNRDNPTVVTTCLDVASCNNIDTLFTTGWCHFLLCLLNTGRITLFSCSALCFEVYNCFIFLITVWWRQNIKSDCFMVCFKIFPVFWYLGNFLSFHFYWPRKCLIFVILCRFFPVFHGLVQLLLHTENTYYYYLGEYMYYPPQLRLTKLYL